MEKEVFETIPAEVVLTEALHGERWCTTLLTIDLSVKAHWASLWK